jgi:parallel beta-helix repeat protein
MGRHTIEPRGPRPARRSGPRLGTAVLGTAVVAAGLFAAVGTDAQRAGAAACSGQVRYAASSNTLYLSAGSVDLPQLREICAAAPLEQVPGAAGTWFLKANLVVSDGATLRIRGTAAGGGVDTLRLLSRASGKREEVVEITAQHGNLDLRAVTVTSWDDAAGGPDRDVAVPAELGSKGKGRAFIRAVSVMDGDTPKESRLDIADSDLGFLGYYAGEAYGVSYKARGCGAAEAEQKVCDVLDVTGSQRRSRFHDNMMGTYTWGAADMTFADNTYERNVMYGLDPHDDSDRLTITGNRARYNGRHGIICSRGCDHVTITGNEVHHNGIPPYTVKDDDDPQVHGIMLHRGVSDSVVADNDVHDQPNGAGIAIFDSYRNTVRNNTLSRNKYGLRTSVGSHDIRFEDNTVRDSTSYAVYAYPGESDEPLYGTADGRPADNVFTGTTIGATGSYAVRLLATDGFRFTGTTLTGGAGAVRIDSSRGFSWEGSALPSGGVVLRDGSRGTVRTPVGEFRTDLSAGNELAVEAPDGRLSQVAPAGETHTVSGSGAELRLGSASATVKRTVTPSGLALTPSAGRVTARLATWGGSGGQVQISGATPGAVLGFRLAGVPAGSRWVLRVDAGPAVLRVAGPGGTVEWSYTEATGGSHAVGIGALP